MRMRPDPLAGRPGAQTGCPAVRPGCPFVRPVVRRRREARSKPARRGTRILGAMRFVRGAMIVAAIAAVDGCHQPTAPAASTGLTGVVVRGPVAPVCQVNASCDAPFSATFDVEQNARPITRFHSGDDGRFTVMLPQGVYSVVPSADAPILAPQSQTKTVTVQGMGLTEVRLEFDTGIR
jgi:hypothetical protein